MIQSTEINIESVSVSQPIVCAICLTADRPEMTRQAVQSFRAQTYANKRLLVYDTSAVCPEVYPTFDAANVLYFHAGARDLTIGALRNEAIEFAQMAACPGQFDIIAHFDSDDQSHPNRIAEQVAILRSSGADCVGYREMLFWREPDLKDDIDPVIKSHHPDRGLRARMNGEAWLYSNADTKYALGTSLCYWRRTWERRPFEATSQGEDERFIRGIQVAAVSSVKIDPRDKGRGEIFSALAEYVGLAHDQQPRMVARIHPGNTSTAYRREAMEREAKRGKNPHWKRVAEWDSYCAGVFA